MGHLERKVLVMIHAYDTLTKQQRKNHVALLSKCFYTGTILNDEYRTVEHLIPSSKSARLICNQKFNLVPSLPMVNSAAGNAPLSVKYALKEYLFTIIMFPNMPLEIVDKTYSMIAWNFMDSYKIDDIILPWQWSNHKFKKTMDRQTAKEYRKKARAVYMTFLTDEEILVGAYSR